MLKTYGNKKKGSFETFVFKAAFLLVAISNADERIATQR
jgi:hypothetical protein